MRETLDKFLNYLLNERGLAKISAEAYSISMAMLYVEKNEDILKTCPKYNDVRDIIVSLKTKRNWSDRQTYKIASMACVFFNWACREDLIQESPMRLGHGFKKAETYQAEFFDWDSDDFKRLMHYPHNTIRFRVMLLILKTSGIRAAECCNLKINDYLGERELSIIKGKGNKNRIVVIDQETENWLKMYIPDLRMHYKGPWLFPTEDFKGPVRPHGLWRMISNLGKKLDIRAYPHKLRHSFASELYSNNAEDILISDLLGHSSMAVTKMYAHLPKKKRKLNYDKYIQSA